MLFTLNHIKEIMYYWGDNYKMQTSHTLCSRPKRYGALQVIMPLHLALGIKELPDFLTWFSSSKFSPDQQVLAAAILLCNHDVAAGSESY